MPEVRLTPALKTELTVAVQLQQILEDGRATRSAVDHLNIKLFGDMATESEKGRFPALERAVEELVKRVDSLEKSVIKYVGLASGAGFVIGVLLHFLWK